MCTKELEKKREQLNILIGLYGIGSDRVLKASQELDLMVLEYMQQEKFYLLLAV